MRRKELLALLDEYIAEHFKFNENVVESFAASYEIPKRPKVFSQARSESRRPPQMLGFITTSRYLDEIEDVDFDKIFKDKASETFSEMVLRLVKESGEKPSTIYRRADVDKQTFWRIKNNRNYQPSKDTAIAFALAFRLDITGAKKLLSSAGFTLSDASKREIIISFFIEHGIFSVVKLNNILYEYEQDILFKHRE